MTKPDTELDDNLPDDTDLQDTAAADDQQPPEESSPERSDTAGEIPSEADDGNAKPGDPLLLAQQPEADDAEPTPPANKPAAKQPAKPAPKAEAPKAKPPAAKATDNPTPDDDQGDDADLKAALADLPEEDWGKVSHKTKSVFLAQRRVVRTAQAAVKQATERATKATEDYAAVERLRDDHGLDNDKFMFSVKLGGALNRGDKGVIPYLEQTLADLRKHHGITVETPKAEVPPPAAPLIDVDKLTELVDRAENYDLDAIAELKKLAAKAKEAKVAKPVTPPAAPKQQEQPPANRHEQPTQTQPTADEAEFGAVYQALVGAGVKPEGVQEHLAGLLKDLTGGDASKLPRAGDRVRAVMAAHGKRIQQTPIKQPAARPLSGRGGPVVRSVGLDPSKPVDPLSHAFKR